MQNFKVGYRIQNIDPRDEPGENYGEYGTVTRVANDLVYVEYDNGNTGNSAKPEKYYKIVERAQCSAPKTMNSIVTFIKNLTLSADEKLLREVGLKNECGEYSSQAQQIVLNYLTGQNETKLVEWANKQSWYSKKRARQKRLHIYHRCKNTVHRCTRQSV